MSIRLNYQSAALRVCIDEVEHGRFCGRITGQRLSSPIFFEDLIDFVVQVDALLDVQKFPQAFQRIRSFTDKVLPSVPAVQTKDELSDLETVVASSGAVTTFSLQIFTRMNASWQGSVDWLDHSDKQHFDSTLELIKIIAARLRL